VRLFAAQRRRESAAIVGADKSNVRLWRKQKAVTSGAEASRQTFTGHKEGRIPELDAVFTFVQERDYTGINSIVLFLTHVQQLYHFSKIQLSTENLTRS
jgi:hypothetical protein